MRVNKANRKKSFIPYALVIPCIVVLLSVTIFPLIYSVNMSLRQFDLSAVYLGKPFIGARNYLDILYDSRFWNAFKNTGILVSGALLGEFFLGTGIALLLAAIGKRRGIVTSIILMPMMLVPVAVGYIWMLMLNVPYGAFNYILRFFFLDPPVWLSSTKWALTGIIIADIWQWTPFIALVMLAGLMSLPHEPTEAAKVDGASPSQVFMHVSLPQLKVIIGIMIIIRAMDLFKNVDKIYVITKGGPGISTETLTLYAYYKGFLHFDIGYASALSFILLIIMVLLITGLIRLLRVVE